jgi:luciferase family oxidoreductase group 1
MLHALYPDRIDLGIGRAPGGTQLEARALRANPTSTPVDDFPQKLVQLLAFLRSSFQPEHPFAKIRVPPEMPGMPEVGLRGSSEWSASAAAQLGLPYAFAHFIDPQWTRLAIEQYKSEFVPSAELQEPQVILALGAICADTDEEAQELALSTRAIVRRFRSFPRDPGLVPSPEEARIELSSGLDPAVFETGEWPRYIIGAPGTVRPKLEAIASELRISELMIVSIIYGHQARLRSYELLGKAFQLEAADAAAVTSRSMP